MNYFLNGLWIVLYLLADSHASAAPLPQNGEFKMATATAKSHDIVVEVSMAEKVSIAKRVSLSIRIRNNGKSPITTGDTGYAPVCRISLVENSSARSQPLTNLGRNVLNGLPERGGQYGNNELAPGEEKTWNVDLRPFFEFSKGKHRVIVVAIINPRKGDSSFEIAVRELQFEITE